MRKQVSGISVCSDRKGEWDQNHNRRQGLRDLHKLHRYGVSFRAIDICPLEKKHDPNLEKLPPVQAFKNHLDFVGVCALKGNQIVLENYAPDFCTSSIHSVQSITKTLVFLIAGKLVDAGKITMDQKITDFIPDIGTGYHHVTLQDVFDMAVLNHYSEDYSDGQAMIGELEDAHGWRVLEGGRHVGLRDFLKTIPSDGRANTDYQHDYKTANTDLAAWICEIASGKPLRSLVIDLVEKMGVENPVFISTDRDGTPFLGGGMHMTLLDLARYGLLISKIIQSSGKASFYQQTRQNYQQGSRMPTGHYYHNFTMGNSDWIGHLGYGGQWLMAYPDQNIVIACLSALSGDEALDMGHIKFLSQMGETVAQSISSKS